MYTSSFYVHESNNERWTIFQYNSRAKSKSTLKSEQLSSCVVTNEDYDESRKYFPEKIIVTLPFFASLSDS